MTSKNSAQKTDNVEGVEAEASVPQQNGGTDKVTVLKNRSEDGKDAIIVSDGEVDNSLKGKLNRLIRNKKVLAGVGAVAGLVVIAIIKSAVGANNTEFEYVVEDESEDYQRGMAMAKVLDEGGTLAEAEQAAENYTTD